MPAHGAGTGDAPPILFRLAEKECAVHGGRKRRLGAKRRLWLLFCLKTGVVRIHAAETCHASAECAVPPRNRERIPRIWSLGRIFPGRLTHGLCSSFRAPRFATRSPVHSREGNPKGRGRSPAPLSRFKGVWGKQAKRRQRRMKRACFEEAARLAAPKRGRESQCRDGVEIRNPPGFLFGGRGGTLLFSKEKCPPSPRPPPRLGGHQGSSLHRGILIHLGPPRPRDNSALGMVWMRIPASSSARLVT